MLFCLLLLLLSRVQLLGFDREWLKRHFTLPGASWSLLEEDILNILVALAWPPVHFLFKFFLLGDLVPDLHDFLTLREGTSHGS